MIYFGYCRLSQPKEYQTESLHQKNAIKQFANDKKVDIEEVFEDKGSGKMTIRLPQMRELLECLEFVEGEKTILVSEVSRICRSMMCWELLKEKFKKWKVNVYAINQKTEFKWNNGSGNGPFNQLALTASEEWESISDRVRSDVERRRAAGMGMGRPAAGYKRDANGKFVECAEEQNILKIMCTMHKKKKSVKQIKEHFENFEMTLRGMPITNSRIRYYLMKNQLIKPKNTGKGKVRKIIHKRKKDGLSDLLGGMNLNRRNRQQYFEVEDVLEKKVKKENGKKNVYFLIKWKGYPHSENTWEPEDNLTLEAKAMFYE